MATFRTRSSMRHTPCFTRERTWPRRSRIWSVGNRRRKVSGSRVGSFAGRIPVNRIQIGIGLTAPDRLLGQRVFNQPQEFGVIVHGLKLGKLANDVLRGVKQEADVGFAEHGGVVER